MPPRLESLSGSIPGRLKSGPGIWRSRKAARDRPPSLALSPRAAKERRARTRLESSALDLGRHGLLDQLDHGSRHRNVIEFLGHLAAVGESPFEELDRFLRRRLVGGI